MILSGVGAAAVLITGLAHEGGPRIDVLGAVINGLIWAAIGSGIGILIDKRKGTTLPTPIGDRTHFVPLNQQPTLSQTGWFADPYGRFEARYRDENGWTNHVATKGRTYVDEPTA